LRYAKFPYRRSIDDFDYEFQPSVDRKLVEDLATLRFIEENRPILFLGQPGCGKTHLAVALATLAVEAGYRGYFSTADNLCRTLVRASIEGNLTSKMKAFTAPAVLVIDDVGLLPLGGTEASAVFFQVVNTATRKATPPSSPPTGPYRTGAPSSETPSSQPPSSTGSCTTPSCSTSKANPGVHASTTASKSRPPTPAPETPANLTNRRPEHRPHVGFR
jgi:energy-coupling factor transporter ATP-binding protein EcfA2